MTPDPIPVQRLRTPAPAAAPGSATAAATDGLSAPGKTDAADTTYDETEKVQIRGSSMTRGREYGSKEMT